MASKTMKAKTKTKSTTSASITEKNEEPAFPSSILAAKKEYTKTKDNHYEVEIRFGSKDHPITRRVFNSSMKNVRELLAESEELEETTSETIVEYHADNIRVIIDNGIRTSQEKVDVAGTLYTSPMYPYRIYSSTEKTKPSPTRKPLSIDKRIRTSFANDLVSIDFTRRTRGSNTQAPQSCEANEVFSIELEILVDNVDAGAIIVTYLTPLLHYILATPILMTNVELSQLQRALEGIEAEKPTDLRISDLSSTGLMGTTAFSITIKTDGVRYGLFFYGYGIYFVGFHGRSRSFAKILALNRPAPNQGLLLDGELVITNGYGLLDPEVVMDYYVFDVIVFTKVENESVKSTSVVRAANENIPFIADGDSLSRRKIIHDVVLKTTFSSIALTLHEKVYNTYNDPPGFFKGCRDILNVDYPFETDGLVFIPSYLPYSPKDTLAKKWKDPSHLTIDFLYDNCSEGVTLYISSKIVTKKAGTSSEHYINKAFEGTLRFPWNGSYEKVFADGTEAILGQIIEFQWLEDKDNSRFIPIRVRDDKDFPSSIVAATDTWNLIHSPITKETITGSSFQLMRRFQNGIKAEIISSLPPYTTIRDDGSGQGGQALQWKDAMAEVTAIEPNPKMRKELERRLEAFHYADHVTVVPIKAQDPTVKELGVFEVVTSFHSITFFQGKDLAAYLDNVAFATKSNGGSYYLMGFDAKRLATLLDTDKYNEPNLAFSIKGNAVNIRVGPEDEENKTLVNQSEYAINYDEIVLGLQQRGFIILEDTYLTEERFMSKEEIAYSSSTRYIRAKYGAVRLEKEVLASLGLPPTTNLPLDSIETTRGTMAGLRPVNYAISIDEMVPFVYEGYNLVRVGTIGDGSCYLHATAFAMSDTYRGYGIDDRIGFVREIRNDFADNLSVNLFSLLGDKEVSVHFSYEGYKKHLHSNNSIGQELDDLFEQTYETNIIVLWYNRGKVIKGTAKPNLRYLRTIILLNINNTHYETVGVVINGKIQTIFRKDHPLVRMLSVPVKP
jgi:hypothetical protein